MMIAKRLEIAIPVREIAGIQALKHFCQSEIFEKSHHIACYYPLKNEFDCVPFFKKIWEQNKKCYLPILSESNCLQFVLYEKNTTLVQNRYQILEPENRQSVSFELLDLVLMPLVAFDKKGNRLGMGAGYYDRTFGTLSNQKIKLFGLGFEVQQVDAIPTEEWDIALDGMITEKRIIIF